MLILVSPLKLSIVINSMGIGCTEVTTVWLTVHPKVGQTVQIAECECVGVLNCNVEIYISAASRDAS